MCVCVCMLWYFTADEESEELEMLAATTDHTISDAISRSPVPLNPGDRILTAIMVIGQL